MEWYKHQNIHSIGQDFSVAFTVIQSWGGLISLADHASWILRPTRRKQTASTKKALLAFCTAKPTGYHATV